MVRGNWQRRVERTEARRAAAKQRKQSKETRGTYKGQVYGLLRFLDKHEAEIRRRRQEGPSSWRLHLWVDTIPPDSPPLMDMFEASHHTPTKGGGRKGRDRSASFGEDTNSKRKGRGRSGSFNDPGSGGKKKSHPRSKESMLDAPEESETGGPRLCQKQFFRGRCDGMKSKKGGGCKLAHYPKIQKTLAEVLCKDPSKKASQMQLLKVSEESILSATATGDDLDVPGMDMMYYIALSWPEETEMVEENPSTSDILTSSLAARSVGIASVVYVAINDNLLFDRYQDGLVVSDQSLFTTVLGESSGRRSRGASLAEEQNASEGTTPDRLPVAVLEHVLTFLDDRAVAIMSMVCSSWTEIGAVSPELWRILLMRREWPLPNVEGMDLEEARDQMRSAFLLHYGVLRDTVAIRDALASVSSPSKKSTSDDMVFQAFSTRRLAPQPPNGCVECKVWADGELLVAYSHDCTLRLFKTIDRHSEGGAGSSRGCREVVCVCVDPFPNTKKLQCRLVAMGLDDDVIGCLCHVHSAADGESFKLTVLSRENFLCAGGASANDSVGWLDLDEGVLNVIDVGDAVLNYLLSLDEADHRLLRLFDFLSDGGNIDEIEILVSQSIAACGYGRFMLDVCISLPEDNPNEEDDNPTTMSVVDRKLVLISASAGAIVWMGESRQDIGRGEEVIMASQERERPSGRQGSAVVFSAKATPGINLAEIDPLGHVQSTQSVEAADAVVSELIGDGWEMQAMSNRPMVISGESVVAGYSLVRELPDDRKYFKSAIVFFSRDSEALTYDLLEVGEQHRVVRMKSFRSSHVIAFCRLYHTSREDAEDDAEEIDGHWFGANPPKSSIWAILVHVPSRETVGRVRLSDGDVFEELSTYDVPFFFDSVGETVGLAYWWAGVALTGPSVRSVGSDTKLFVSDDSTMMKQKKKRKGQRKRERKKDVFARGMSMRG